MPVKKRLAKRRTTDLTEKMVLLIGDHQQFPRFKNAREMRAAW
jgi:hypothetical protein